MLIVKGAQHIQQNLNSFRISWSLKKAKEANKSSRLDKYGLGVRPFMNCYGYDKVEHHKMFQQHLQGGE